MEVENRSSVTHSHSIISKAKQTTMVALRRLVLNAVYHAVYHGTNSIQSLQYKPKADKVKKVRCPTRSRTRQSVSSVYRGLGPEMFCRAYRMNYTSFWRLHSKLQTRIQLLAKRGHKEPFHYPNGKISSDVRLAIALRYFAGGSLYDLIAVFGVSMTDARKSECMVGS